ncbi:MAG: HAD-IIA family hydrolase [Candidatus Limnocylindria bacterium]
MPPQPATLRLVIFDLDGVVYRGNRPIPGAVELTASLRSAGCLVRYATNNSTVTRDDYAARLGAMGIEARADEIVTSTWATVEHLRLHDPEVRSVIAVGERGLLEELLRAGFDVTAARDAVSPEVDGGPPARRFDACIVGLDRAFDYRALAGAVAAVRAGARLIATNADVVYPNEVGSLPGAGAIVAAVATGSGTEPVVIGKPEPGMFRLTLEAAGVAPEASLVVGDNADADVVAARRAGIRSLLVLTGVTPPDAVERLSGDRTPDFIAEDPAAIGRLILPWVAG